MSPCSAGNLVGFLVVGEPPYFTNNPQCPNTGQTVEVVVLGISIRATTR